MLNLPISVYAGAGFSDWEIGDITVIYHDNKYHLFHLIIPNHDYIAHAVSDDGISWSRVKNALFVGDPGAWDDDMLWTMHVCNVNGRFEMYYTGLHRRDRGVVSKIGLAISDDLYDWEKVKNDTFPFGPVKPHYETFDDANREWLSFRDPYRFDHKGKTYFLICTRSSTGPLYRRGCVGLVQQVGNRLKYLPPLHFPMVYDDVECPCVFTLNGKFYLIGSIREDIKVRYWIANDFLDEYQAFHSNVLMPQGNYAARIMQHEGRVLIFAFYYTYGKIDSLRVILPPKELDTDSQGRLLLKSFYYWETIVQQTIVQEAFPEPGRMLKNPSSSLERKDGKWFMSSRSGYEIFYFPELFENYIWEGVLTVEGMGKLGIVCDLDEEASGYYISFDVVNGHVQLRAWGFNPDNLKTAFKFIGLQDSVFHVNADMSYKFRLIRFGNYIELSIDDTVRLTLIDSMYNNRGMGFYTSSSAISLQQSTMKLLPDPKYEYFKS